MSPQNSSQDSRLHHRLPELIMGQNITRKTQLHRTERDCSQNRISRRLYTTIQNIFFECACRFSAKGDTEDKFAIGKTLGSLSRLSRFHAVVRRGRRTNLFLLCINLHRRDAKEDTYPRKSIPPIFSSMEQKRPRSSIPHTHAQSLVLFFFWLLEIGSAIARIVVGPSISSM
ncbi:hypothetical protein BJV78DRAFT_1194925 [Lactifluus subvellereus]|nr:hypothetical protein BJV78DRAFT_1194925 [Lactifluus subvellereus]